MVTGRRSCACCRTPPCTNHRCRAPRSVGSIRFGVHRGGARSLWAQARCCGRDRDEGRPRARHGRCPHVVLCPPLWPSNSEDPGSKSARRSTGGRMITAHKIVLDPNPAQENYFARACGTARFAYNWALAEWNRQYKAGERPAEAALRRQLNSLKDDAFPWMREVTKNAPQQAIKNLGTAFKNYFADLKKPSVSGDSAIRSSKRRENTTVSGLITVRTKITPTLSRWTTSASSSRLSAG